MDKKHIRILLVEDEQDHRSVFKELIKDIDFPGATIEINEAGDAKTAIDVVAHHAPDLIVTDLSLGDTQTDLLQFIWQLRQNVLTFHLKIIVVTAHELTKEKRQLLNDAIRISDLIRKPIDNDNFQDSVRRRIREVLELRNSSTGLPGRTEGERVLEFAIADRITNPDIPAVYLNPDLRKIGLSANDRFGEAFGNSIIDLFANLLTSNLEELYPFPKLERSNFQIGGDEFGIIIRGQRGSNQKDVIRSAEWLARRLGTRFDREVRQLYPEPYRSMGFLHGPNVRDKQGRIVALFLPAARIGIMPLYKQHYRTLAEISMVANRLQALIKGMHNRLETQANAVLGLPAAEYPAYAPEKITSLYSVVSDLASQADSAFETASFGETIEWLALHRETTGQQAEDG